jgi:hypothetical protein
MWSGPGSLDFWTTDEHLSWKLAGVWVGDEGPSLSQFGANKGFGAFLSLLR